MSITFNTHNENLALSPADRLNDLPVLFAPLKLDELTQNQRLLISQIDDKLPQTQCGLCGHHDGCLPYAHGIVVHGEATNLCVPGGQAVSDAIATFMDAPKLRATPSKWAMDEKTQRPIEVRAVIIEDDCIGCTKCIPACPVDAIIGTAKHMHSVITELCTGCELCLAPCPVDCITLVPAPRHISDSERTAEQNHLRKRYHQHLARVVKQVADGVKPVVSTIESQTLNVLNSINSITDSPQAAQAPSVSIDEQTAKNTIAAAKLRTQIKKLNKQISLRPSDELHAQVQKLQAELDALP